LVAGSDRFGTFLRGLRRARRLTLEDVERATLSEPEPVTRSLLSRLENGKARISTLKLMALARLYRVRVALLAERLELEHQLAQIDGVGRGAPATDELKSRVLEAGRAGRLHEALRLVEATHPAGSVAAREARLELARLLADDGQSHSALRMLQDVATEPLSARQRARACYFLSRTALDVGRTLLARGAFSALSALPRPWPEDVEAGAAMIEAELLESDGELERALDAWLSALDAARSVVHRSFEGTCLVRLASVERRRGSTRKALSWCRKALAFGGDRDDERLLVRAFTECGRIHRTRGRNDLARQAWQEARRLARGLELHDELLAIYTELWRLARTERDKVATRACLRSLRHLVRFVDVFPREADDLADALAEGSGEKSAPPIAAAGS